MFHQESTPFFLNEIPIKHLIFMRKNNSFNYKYWDVRLVERVKYMPSKQASSASSPNRYNPTLI